MKVWVKDLAIKMELGSKGIILDVYDPSGKTFLGDLRIGKAKIEWCPGKTAAGNGKQKDWRELIDWFMAK
jgi:hypothetical protein